MKIQYVRVSVHSIFVKLDFSFHITYLKLCFDNWIISVIFLIWKFLNIIIHRVPIYSFKSSHIKRKEQIIFAKTDEKLFNECATDPLSSLVSQLESLPISATALHHNIIIPYLLKLDLYYVQGLQCIFEGWADGQSGYVTQMGNGDNWHLDIQSIIFKILLPPIKWNHQNLLMMSKIRLSLNLHKALNNQLDLVNQGRNKSSPLTFSLRSVSPWDCPVILVGGLPDLSIVVLTSDRLRWTRKICASDLRYWTIGKRLVPGALEWLAGL